MARQQRKNPWVRREDDARLFTIPLKGGRDLKASRSPGAFCAVRIREAGRLRTGRHDRRGRHNQARVAVVSCTSTWRPSA